MAAILKLRRGTTTPTLVESELFFNTSTNTLVVGQSSGNHTLVKIGSNTGDINLTGDITASNLLLSGNAKVDGNITFGGSLITFGDSDTDDIVFTGELSSSLIPNNDNAFDIGTPTRRYKSIYAASASFSDVTLDGTGILSSSEQISSYNTFLEIDGDGVVSQSAQINVNDTQNFTSFSSSVDTRIDSLETFSSSLDSEFLNTNGDDVVSGSDQVTASLDLRYLEINGDSVITGSDQVTSSLDLRYLEINGDSVVSGSDQVTSSLDLRYLEINGDGVVSGSSQILDGSGILSSSAQDFDTFSGSVDTRLDELEDTFSSSVDTRLDDLESTGSNHETRLDTLEGSFSSSVDSRLDDLEGSFSTSVDSRLDTLEGDFSSSVDSRLDSIQSYTSSLKTSFDVSGQNLTIYGNLTVQGTQTSLNTNDLIVEDKLIAIASGSTTSAQADGAGIFISGADASMTWEDTTSHIVFNQSVSSSVGFYGDGSNLTGLSADSVEYSDVLNKPTLISQSAQVDLTQTNNYTSGIKTRLNVEGVFSQSSQINANDIQNFDTNVVDAINDEGVHSGSFLGTATTTNLTEGANQYYTTARVQGVIDSNNIVSGSSQIEFAQISNIPSGLVSGSSQITDSSDIVSGSDQLTSSLDSIYLQIDGDGVVSQSAQIDVNSTQNFTTFSSSVDTRLDDLETDQHTHSNKSNLDTIDQNMAQSDEPTFANLSLTTLTSLSTGEVNAVFSGSGGSLGTRALGTAAFYNVSGSVGNDPNSVPTNAAVDAALIAAGAGDITAVNDTSLYSSTNTGIKHTGDGTEVSGEYGQQGNIVLAIDTGSAHFVNAVTNLSGTGDGVVSGSDQLTSSLDLRYLEINGDGVFSQSAQVHANETAGWATDFTAQLDINTVLSGSSQVDITATSGYGALNTRVTDLETFSSSLDDTFVTETELNTATASLETSIGTKLDSSTYTTDSQSFDSRIDSLESFSSSLDDSFVTEAELNASSSTLQGNIDNKLDSSTYTTDSQSFDSRIDTLEGDSHENPLTFNDTDTIDLVRTGDVITANVIGGIISSSAQIDTLGFLQVDGDGVVSESAQIDVTATTNYSSINQYSDTKVKTKLNAETVISQSAQVDVEQTTNFTTFSQSLDGRLDTLEGASNENPLTFNDTATIDLIRTGDIITANAIGGIVSSSAQIDTLGFLQVNGDSVVSGSDQVTQSLDSHYVTLEGAQTIGGTKTFNDIVVNGTGSFAYLTSVEGTTKIIGDAFIVLNNDTPTERYAGISVYDSGSANTTASFQFDGSTNDWFYEYDDGAVDYGVVLFGPEYNTKGSPTYNTNNTIPKSDGGHHLNDSNITDNGTTITLGSAVNVSGITNFNDTTQSTNKTSGAVIIDGGVGIAKTLNVGEDVVAYASSDERLKDNITPIENPLEKINKIGGYSFVWNEKQDIYKGRDYGVVAQEIEKVLPELVNTRDNGYKAVKYDKLVSLLIEGIKELSSEVKELKSKLKD